MAEGAFNSAGLDAKGGYRPRGEEIDGSFVLDQRVFLYEAKWTQGSLPASSIYSFKGKVDGKLVGTIGVYISMAGFGEDTVDALERGTDLNVILVDDEDLAVAIEIGFASVLRSKLRAAAERGTVHFPVRAHEVGHAEDEPVPVPNIAATASRLAVVVEGKRDRVVVARFARRLVRELAFPAEFAVDVVASSGLVALPGTAAAVLDANPGMRGMVILADGDYEDVDERRAAIAGDERVRGRDMRVIVAQPTVPTAWVGAEPDQRQLLGYLRAIDRVDLGELRRKEPSFDEFVAALAEAARVQPPTS